ncbi:Na+/H+ antiporter subunit E [Brachybacterium sacelli]|uniref:Multisubunit Na+/H+ antiporter MnhE subunit n=1 Tax=Brachybacterium sacelli TaxID=173364 RepID=A0ABS4WWH8_9MICO|nr:Na+/H+ antiporter subunit E [Brachybacterium sacelli]MBP2380560.1 multisubunit Na+/H+ antiporter MnhE subunit [Brachybacterium sacelli]
MRRLRNSISYVLWILGEIVKGSVDVAKGVYSPGTRSSPAIVEYPLRATTDVEIIMMASSITITPGTLVVGIAHGTLEESSSLFVHALFAESRDQVTADLSEMEERLLRATRGSGGADASLRARRGGLADERFADGQAARKAHDHVRDARPDRPTTSEEER